MTIIFYTKQGKFETDDYYEMPWSKLHSLNEETPSLITFNGNKYWHDEGEKHRLNGPAVIWSNEIQYFYLNGNEYDLDMWMLIHPNQNIVFQTKMKLKYA